MATTVINIENPILVEARLEGLQIMDDYPNFVRNALFSKELKDNDTKQKLIQLSNLNSSRSLPPAKAGKMRGLDATLVKRATS